MEETLYILIDSETRVIRLFGDQNRTIPFQYAFILPSIISGRVVSYVSAVEPMNGDDLVDYMATILTPSDAPSEPLFFRCKQEGYTRISDVKLTFNGPKDAKAFAHWGYDIFDRSPMLQKLLAQDKIEVLTESQSVALKRNRIDPKAKDKALDSILLTKSVKDFQENADMFGFEGGGGDEIDPAEDKEVFTEAEQILREHRLFGKDRK